MSSSSTLYTQCTGVAIKAITPGSSCTLVRELQAPFLVLGTTCYILAISASFQGASSEPQKELQKLIRALGSDDFDERQAAEKKLREVGEPAFSALNRERDHSDPEIAARIRRLLSRRSKAAKKVFQELETTFLKAEDMRIRCDILTRDIGSQPQRSWKMPALFEAKGATRFHFAALTSEAFYGCRSNGKRMLFKGRIPSPVSAEAGLSLRTTVFRLGCFGSTRLLHFLEFSGLDPAELGSFIEIGNFRGTHQDLKKGRFTYDITVRDLDDMIGTVTLRYDPKTRILKSRKVQFLLGHDRKQREVSEVYSSYDLSVSASDDSFDLSAPFRAPR